MRLKLEVFEPTNFASARVEAEEEMEEIRLAAFEKGYAAGWEDATTAETGNQRRLRAEIGHQLQELAFTFHEARALVLRDLEPLLRAMAEVVLPRVAHDSLAPLVAEAIAELAQGRADVPVTLRLCPQDAEAMGDVLKLQSSAPLELLPDDTLAPGQIWLRAEQREARIDIDAACRHIGEAVRNHFHIEPEARQHG